jgi:hypothetical protein
VVDEGLPQQAEDRTVIWIDPGFMNGWPRDTANLAVIGPRPRFRNQLMRHARYELRTCFGDLDGDYDVDGVDFRHFLTSFGAATGDANYLPAADYNNDGVINADDLGLFAKNLGSVECRASLP